MKRVDTLAESRRLLTLAWPVVLTSLNWTILHVTDVVVVGQVDTHQAAALGASRALTYIAIVAGLAGLSGVLVGVARADGAKDWLRTGGLLREGLLLGLIAGLATMAVLLIGAAWLLRMIGVEASLLPAAALVTRIMALSYPASFVLIAASYYLEGISRPRRVMEVNLAMLPINGVLAWMLATGAFGLPVLGAAGAALATVIASWIGVALMLGATWAEAGHAQRGVRDLRQVQWRSAARGVPALASFGAIPSLAAALELAGFAILIALSTQLGTTVAHAFQIVFSLHNLTFALAMGLGSAAGVRVGNAVGAGEVGEARSRALIATGLACAATGIAAVLLGVFAAPVATLFPATLQVHQVAAAMLIIWVPFIVFDGAQVVLTYALRSLGDQVAAGVNSVIAFFVVTGGAGWLLVDGGWGSTGLALASGVGMLAAALLQGERLWRVTRRITAVPPPRS